MLVIVRIIRLVIIRLIKGFALSRALKLTISDLLHKVWRYIIDTVMFTTLHLISQMQFLIRLLEA